MFNLKKKIGTKVEGKKIAKYEQKCSFWRHNFIQMYQAWTFVNHDITLFRLFFLYFSNVKAEMLTVKVMQCQNMDKNTIFDPLLDPIG